MESERSSSFSSGSAKHFSPDRPDIFSLANVSRVSSNHMDGYVGTPSPSDSGVGELEAMLREKDAAIIICVDIVVGTNDDWFKCYRLYDPFGW
jgi:hypothetical protein